MCGIVGQFNFGGTVDPAIGERDRALVVAMRDSIAHRGPDDGGVLIAHGDRAAGYAVRVADGRLIHHYVHGAGLTTTTSTSPVPWGRTARLEVRVDRRRVDGEPALLGHAVERRAETRIEDARIRHAGLSFGQACNGTDGIQG